MKPDAVFIGVDAGTTKIKASIYDLKLREIGSAEKDVMIYSPTSGASEIDMDELWGDFCEVLANLKLSCNQVWDKIAGIGISGQGDGLWPIGKDGRPVRCAMLWNDTRSKELLIENISGLEDLLKRECANTIFAGSMPALQKWLKRNEPDTYKAIGTSLHCKDWLNYNLTDQIVSDYSDITCSSGMNMKTLAYVPEIFELLDIKEALDTMPKAVEPTDVIGEVTEQAAAATGLPRGIPVIAGCLDCCAASVGADFYSAGEAFTIIGTAMINEVCLSYDEINPKDLRGLLLYHVVKGRYIKIMNTANGASSIDAIKNLLCPGEAFDDMFEKLDSVPIGSNGVMFHPYLYGERAPFKNPFAFASFFGMRSHHTRYDLMRAAYEGLAMSFYDCYQDVKGIKTLYLSGGVSKSSMICQMFCDVIGIPVKRQTNDELGTLGIIKMLQVALGYAKEYESLITDSYVAYFPDMERHRQYKEVYRQFVEYRKSISPHWVSHGKS